jgi:hypothetical protein
MWRVDVTTVQTEMQQCILRIVEVYVTVNNMYILSAAQKSFNGELTSPETIKCT